MRWACCALGLAVGLAGCVSPAEDRARQYNDDGISLFERGYYSQAGESFQAALAVNPADPAVLYNLGQCYDRQGDATRAEQYYQQCLQRSPNHGACRHALASMLVRTGRRAEAVRMIEDWLAREPRLAAAYAEDGWLWRQSGDLPRAQARLQQALDLDPHNERALIELGILYETLEYPDRALALYERVLADKPGQTEVKRRQALLVSRGVGQPRP